MTEPWQARQIAAGYARQCPLCPTVVQPMPKGTLADGMRQHYRVVHPGEEVPRGNAFWWRLASHGKTQADCPKQGWGP